MEWETELHLTAYGRSVVIAFLAFTAGRLLTDMGWTMRDRSYPQMSTGHFGTRRILISQTEYLEILRSVRWNLRRLVRCKPLVSSPPRTSSLRNNASAGSRSPLPPTPAAWNPALPAPAPHAMQPAVRRAPHRSKRESPQQRAPHCPLRACRLPT